jgi:hypothetical protein
MADSLPLTGERTVPGVAAENYWYRRHEAAYLAVAGLLPAGRWRSGSARGTGRRCCADPYWGWTTTRPPPRTPAAGTRS